MQFRLKEIMMEKYGYAHFRDYAFYRYVDDGFLFCNDEKTKDEFYAVYDACLEIIKSGITVNLYNFPLCNIDKRLYSIANRSITDYKIRYKEMR